MWHLARRMLDDHKGSSTSTKEGLRRLADMENWHIKLLRQRLTSLAFLSYANIRVTWFSLLQHFLELQGNKQK